MLATIIAWIVISLVLLSFGDILIHSYNKLCKQKEEYNLPDIFILGMCFILIPLSSTSFWLPSNHYILLAFIIVSIIYWAFNKERLKDRIKKAKLTLSTLSSFHLIIILASVISILSFVIWSSCVFDGAFYHHQNIRWNEEFAAVPGLANLEDRFGFNSNYLLISAIFSFRFMFGEPLYALQSTLFVYITCWLLTELIKSNFKIKHIIASIIFLVFFSINSELLCDSSTDIVPNLCTFYFILKFVFYPNLFKDQLLFVILLPISLVTFKLSTFPLSFASLYIIILYLKKKTCQPVLFCAAVATSIIFVWFARNIIVSGYLVFPLHEVDLFSFDWKVPGSVAKLERWGIHGYAKKVFYETVTTWHYLRHAVLTYKIYLINNSFIMLSFISIAISPLIVLYSYIKKKAVNHVYYILYIFSSIYILYWAVSAPDFRFANGIILSSVFIILVIFLGDKADGSINLKNPTLIAFSLILLFSGIKKTQNYYKLLHLEYPEIRTKSFASILCIPYGAKDQAKARGVSIKFEEYRIKDDIIIFLSEDETGRTFDQLPATANIGLPFQHHSKAQDVRTIGLRGKTLQEGFRTKKEYLDILDSMIKEITGKEYK